MDGIKTAVKKKYGALARAGSPCCGPSCCEGSDSAETLVDYGDLSRMVVPGSDLGLGCGTPTAHAALAPGEIVVDLGSGAGIDAFLAAREVGPEGRVIGVDMTPEMIAKAEANAVEAGVANVDFRLGEIESLPVAAGSVDVVLSNCVINLVPDKRMAYAEIFRVLRAGGRFAISDMVSYGEIPPTVREDLELWAGCVAGALDRDAYLALIREAGFERVAVVSESRYPGAEADRYGVSSVTVVGWKPR